MSLVIKSELCGPIRLVAPEGRLDTETSSDLELFAHDQIKAGESHFVIDLGAIDYVSSAGLRVLLMMAKSLGGDNGSMRLSGLSPHVQEVFDIAGFTQLFKLFPTMEDAVLEHPHAPEDKDEARTIIVALVGSQSSTADSGGDDLANLAASLLGAGKSSPAPAKAAPVASAPASPRPAAPAPKERKQGFLGRLFAKLFGR